jgi:hypothetical protein
MDTTEPQQYYADGAISLAAAQSPPDESESIRAFERFVQACFSSPAADDQFWTTIASRLEQEEQAMDAAQVRRFEIAVDYFLTMHGLPAWTVMRQRRLETAAGDIARR